MSKGVFITGTGTDVGKTYVAGLVVKKMKETEKRISYYKAALSGATSLENSDAGYVKKISGITQPYHTMISYLYQNAYSPHLAAQMEGNPLELSKIQNDFEYLKQEYDFITVEGSGGIICPIRDDKTATIYLEDIIKELQLPVLLVADAGLGTINAVTLTCSYCKQKDILVKGIILNNYKDTIIEQDNIKMIEKINNIPVITTVEPYAKELEIDLKSLEELYSEV